MIDGMIAMNKQRKEDAVDLQYNGQVNIIRCLE